MDEAYEYKGKIYHPETPDFYKFLSLAHGDPERPKCCCRSPGAEMYVAKLGTTLIIKRMPNTGVQHSPECPSFEPPAETSGLGEVRGTAIQTDLKTGLTALKFDFALTKTGGRAAPAGEGSEKSTVKSDAKKLTLRGALHYLIDEAGFTRWSPAMQGKRNWYVFRKYILQAACDKTVKGGMLADNLFMPESFSVERKDEIAQHARGVFNQLKVANKGARRMKILLGEVKEFTESRFGKKLIVKHLPESFFMLDDSLYKRLAKRFAAEMSLWDAIEGSHLLIISTFSVADTGIASLEEASLVITNENWIPFENTDEWDLLNAALERRFVKGLRYNLPSTKPIASLVLSDTPKPTALYIVPGSADEAYEEELEGLREDSQLDSWVWRAGEDAMPALPTKAEAPKTTA